jgi:hypothetical protein
MTITAVSMSFGVNIDVDHQRNERNNGGKSVARQN